MDDLVHIKMRRRSSATKRQSILAANHPKSHSTAACLNFCPHDLILLPKFVDKIRLRPAKVLKNAKTDIDWPVVSRASLTVEPDES